MTLAAGHTYVLAHCLEAVVLREPQGIHTLDGSAVGIVLITNVCVLLVIVLCV